MIVQITENRQIGGRWFLSPQQYALLGQRIAPVSSLYNSCRDTCQGAGIIVYDIVVGNATYTIPSDMAALIEAELPSTDMRGSIEKWEASRTKDIAAPTTGGHTDVVEQTKKFLGFNIRQHVRNVNVDQVRLRDLRETERYDKH